MNDKQLVNLFKIRYPDYTYISHSISCKIIDEIEQKKITFIAGNKGTVICPICKTHHHYVNTKKERVVIDIGYKDYAVDIKVPFDIYYCKSCKKFFSQDVSIVPKGSKFSFEVYKIIEDNSLLSSREIAHKLSRYYKVKISFDQVNEHIRGMGDEDVKILEKNKQSLEQEMHSDNYVSKVTNYSQNPSDYILDVLEDEFGIVALAGNHLKSKYPRAVKYPNTLFVISALSARMREQIATYMYPFSLTSAKLINSIGYNILDKSKNIRFAASTFLRYIYQYTKEELEINFNSLLKELNHKGNVSSRYFIVDSTQIVVNKEIAYENKGMVRNANNETSYGYKLTVMYGIETRTYEGFENDLLIPAKVSLDPINISDVNIIKSFVNIDDLKEGDTLILDRGYTDIKYAAKLSKANINVIIPAKKGSNILLDGLSSIGVDIIDRTIKNVSQTKEMFLEKYRNSHKSTKPKVHWRPNPVYPKDNQEITLVDNLTYSVGTGEMIKVRLAIIRFKKSYKTSIDKLFENDENILYYYDEDYYYAGIYTTNMNLSAEEIVIKYKKRMKIENKFRQLKQEWQLERLYSKRYSYISFHIFSTVLALGLFELFKTTKAGAGYKTHTIKTVKGLMESELKENQKVFVANERYFNDYTMKDFLTLFQFANRKLQNNMIQASE